MHFSSLTKNAIGFSVEKLSVGIYCFKMCRDIEKPVKNVLKSFKNCSCFTVKWEHRIKARLIDRYKNIDCANSIKSRIRTNQHFFV